eukprot:Nk52_evm30s207 gene=Nk52_evmTU30s207
MSVRIKCKKLTKHEIVLCSILLINVVLVCTAIIYRKDVLHCLQKFTDYVQSTGWIGRCVLGAAIVATSFPPVPFYGWMLIVCGFIYKFPGGVVPAIPAALLGGVICFIGARYMLKGYVNHLLLQYPKFRVIQKAVSDEGFWFLLIVRLAPFPYPLMNIALAASSVPFHHYFLATAFSLIKVLLHIYLGSKLSTLSNITSSDWVSLVVGGFFCALAYAVVYRTVTKALKKYESRERIVDFENDEEALLRSGEGIDENNSDVFEDENESTHQSRWHRLSYDSTSSGTPV